MAAKADRLFRTDQVRELDHRAIFDSGIPGYELMQRAAAAAFKCLQAMVMESGQETLLKRVLIVCGGGNNGGDGYVLARLAREAGMQVTLVALLPESGLKGDAYTACRDWHNAGGKSLEAFNQIRIGQFDLIVDAILGTGLQREVTGNFRKAITWINAQNCPVLALDIPSGLNGNTGKVLGAAVKASKTISFVGLKQGLFTAEAGDYCGSIEYNDLAIPADVFERTVPAAHLITAPYVKSVLKARSSNAHKGQFGHVLIIGGDYGMSGAVQMAGSAALRVGAGLVSIATRYAHAAYLNVARPELMCHGVEDAGALEQLLQKATVIAIGPGLGKSDWGRQMLAKVLESRLPLVVDADGLNLLAEEPAQRGNWILTPHPGEAAKLLARNGSAEIQADRFAAVSELVHSYHATAVLKGAGSLVADMSDSGKYLTGVCNLGNPGMASAGMGDVLTGTIAGLVAQRLSLSEAARAGVWLHAYAGDLAAKTGQRGMLASDLLPFLRVLVNPDVQY